MKKKVLIIIISTFLLFILTWISFIFLFPVSIIDGEAYNAKKLEELSKQRELAYNELYDSLHDEINKNIYDLYIKPIDSKNNIEKQIIYNGEVLLLDKINKNRLFYLTKEELKILRNTIFAKYGYIFQSKELFKHFNRFTWYEPQYNNIDKRLSENDRKLIEIIREVENKQTNIDIQNILEIFYTKSIDIDKTYYQLMTECNSKILFPLQNKTIYALNDIFPARINVIEYNNQFYNEFALKLFMEQYENIIKKTIEAKTSDILGYINYYSSHSESELLTITNFIGYKYYYEIIGSNIFDYYINQCVISNKVFNKINLSIVYLSYNSIFNIPVIEINEGFYSLIAINELKKSMKIISSCLIENTKNIMIKGVNDQTNIYLKNIDDYVKWYYSSITRIDKTITKIAGFLFGFSATDEEYFIENFYRIMNKNTNLDKIINTDMENQSKIIVNIFNDYLDIINIFEIKFNQETSYILTTNDYIGPYRDDIIAYFEQVYDTLNAQNNFHLQDFRVKDNNIVKNTKTSLKLLSSVNFLGGILVDYLALKTQKLLNSAELKKRIYDKMIEGQENKIAIIKNPFNFSIDKLKVGSILFVDNYFVGLNTYQHYGVYIGNKKVIHFAPLEGQEISAKNGVIHETTLDKFLYGRALQIDLNIEIKFSENEIIQRARSRLGEKGYDLFTNNCEHFARWCVTGDSVSYQINDLPKKIDTTILTIQENLDRVSKFTEFVELFF